MGPDSRLLPEAVVEESLLVIRCEDDKEEACGGLAVEMKTALVVLVEQVE